MINPAVGGHVCAMHIRKAEILFGTLLIFALGGCGGGGAARDGGGGSGGNPGTGGTGSGGSDGNPGTGGSGSGGNPAPDASVDVPSQPDGSSTERPAGNACVAAGGTCATLCMAPTNPGLNVACGPAWLCCMPLPDAGPRDASKPMIGPDGKFACGNSSCDPKTQYCRGLVGGITGDSYSCMSIPASCGSTATCRCVAFAPCQECYEDSGAVIQLCAVGHSAAN